MDVSPSHKTAPSSFHRGTEIQISVHTDVELEILSLVNLSIAHTTSYKKILKVSGCIAMLSCLMFAIIILNYFALGSPMLYRATEFVIRPSTIVEAVVGDTAIFECFTTGM